MTVSLTFAVSLLLGAFGICTMWMATGRSDVQRKWAPIVGLTAQLAWGWYACLLGPAAGGLWILVALYAGVYVRGIWVQWDLRRWAWQRFGSGHPSRCVDCGARLTANEREYYGSNCARCEGIAFAEMERVL
jgi:hypothetical protein